MPILDFLQLWMGRQPILITSVIQMQVRVQPSKPEWFMKMAGKSFILHSAKFLFGPFQHLRIYPEKPRTEMVVMSNISWNGKTIPISTHTFRFGMNQADEEEGKKLSLLRAIKQKKC